MTLQLHVKISTRHTELKFLQPEIKNPNFPYDWHFFQPGMKIWYYAHMNSLFIFIKIKMATSHGRFKLTDDKSYKMFTRIEQFICTFLFLNIGRFQWLISEAVVRRCSVKKGVRRNFTKFTGKHLCQRLFFNKVAGLCNFIKKESLTKVLSCESCEISKNTFFTEHLWWLLLWFEGYTTITWSNNSDITLTCWRTTNCNFLLQRSIFIFSKLLV